MTGAVLTEEQMLAMERAKEEKIAWGEIETEHVGYLGSQDTFYVGTLKGVGRVYQQTFIDTYSSVGFCKWCRCEGRTPMVTWAENKDMAREKLLAS